MEVVVHGPSAGPATSGADAPDLSGVLVSSPV